MSNVTFNFRAPNRIPRPFSSTRFLSGAFYPVVTLEYSPDVDTVDLNTDIQTTATFIGSLGFLHTVDQPLLFTGTETEDGDIIVVDDDDLLLSGHKTFNVTSPAFFGQLELTKATIELNSNIGETTFAIDEIGDSLAGEQDETLVLQESTTVDTPKPVFVGTLEVL